MKNFQRGLKASAMLLSLFAAGVMAEFSTSGYLDAAVLAGCECGNADCGGGAEGHSVIASPVAIPAGDCGCAAAPVEVVYSYPVHTTEPVAGASCGCASTAPATPTSGCRSCRKQRSCPQCDCQFCELDVKKGEVEKKSYKIEQKEVCVPAVRLPWKKNCPPKRSRVRTVNTLKKHKYKCPKCEYKWSVHEPEDFDDSVATSPSKVKSEPVTSAPSGSGTKSVYPDPTDALGDVPRPPLEK